MNPEGSEALFVQKERGMFSLSGKSLITILRAVLEKGYAFRFKLKGSSMLPFLKEGDSITVYPLKEIPPQRGIIAAFVHPDKGKLAVHRVIDKKGSCFVLKGDNNRSDDGMVPIDKILGCLGKVERNGKRVSFGMGPEKHVIAFLSRKNIISFISRLIRELLLSKKSARIR